MATTRRETQRVKHALVVTWTGLADSEAGDSFSFAGFERQSVQATGNFGAGGTVILEGSNDGGTTWFPLQDEEGAPISFTAAGGVSILERTMLLRPRATAGTGLAVVISVFGASYT